MNKNNSDKPHFRVLHLRASGSILGAENVIIEIASLSEQFGFESIIGIPALKSIPIPEYATVLENKNINFNVFLYTHKFSLKLIKEIREYVATNKIDIIHCHGYQEDFYALLARSGAELIATNHLWKKTDAKLKLYAKMDSYILRFFNKIVAVSRPIADDMALTGINAENISIIPNGIDIRKFSPTDFSHSSLKNDFNIPEENIVVGMVSSLTKEKGHRYAISSFSDIVKDTDLPLTLLIIGDGDQKPELSRMAKEHGISDKVVFGGKRFDIPDLLAIMDIYILPSLIEGLPMSLLEAMASNLPVIATKVGDIPSVIVDSENGYLVDAQSSDQLTEKLRLLINNPDTRSKFGNAARATIEDNFSSVSMTRSYYDLYKQVLSR